MTDYEMYSLIRGFGYTTSDQTDEIVEAIFTRLSQSVRPPLSAQGGSMTDKQPEALRLADELEKATAIFGGTGMQAAAELRRLHVVNAELVEALRQIFDLPEDSRIHYKVARKAIAKATGEQ